jgi:hypothetical protein
MSPFLAHRDISLRYEVRSLSGHSGHGRACCWLDLVANDPKATSEAPFECASLSREDAMVSGEAMKRRDFIKAFASLSVGITPAVRAQQAEKIRRVGVLMAHREGDPEFQEYLSAFRHGLEKFGWIEGRNIRIET